MSKLHNMITVHAIDVFAESEKIEAEFSFDPKQIKGIQAVSSKMVIEALSDEDAGLYGIKSFLYLGNYDHYTIGLGTKGPILIKETAAEIDALIDELKTDKRKKR